MKCGWISFGSCFRRFPQVGKNMANASSKWMRVCDACNEGGSSLHIQSVGSSRAPLCSGVFFSYMVFEEYALSFLAGHCSKILLLKAGLCFLCQLAKRFSLPSQFWIQFLAPNITNLWVFRANSQISGSRDPVIKNLVCCNLREVAYDRHPVQMQLKMKPYLWCRKFLILVSMNVLFCDYSSSVLVYEPSMSKRLVMEQRSLSLRFPGISRGFQGFKKSEFYSGTGNLGILSSSNWYFNNAKNWCQLTMEN